MRVAVVSPNWGEYSETFIRDHVTRLGEQVDSVIHLYGSHLPLRRDQGRVLPPGVLWAVGEVAGRVSGQEAARISALLAGNVGRWKRIRAWFLARYLRRVDIDVVLAEYGPTGVAMEAVTRRAGIPLVVHFHGYDAYRHSVVERHGRYADLFERAAAVVAVSGPMVDRLESLGADRSKLHLNPYGIDLEEFEPSNVAETDPVLLGVGRFVEKKAPQLTLLAFARATRERPRARLVLAGDGPLLESCHTLIRALEIEERVSLPGAVSRREVRRLMQEARGFVQHSVRPTSGDSEGNPVAVREAMASGLPVVSTRHAGIPETVEHGESGLLVEEHDWRAMAGHMASLLDDPARAARLGRNARRTAERDFAMEASITRLAGILEAAVPAPRRV